MSDTELSGMGPVSDGEIIRCLLWSFPLEDAEKYARKISQNRGGEFSAQYGRVADLLKNSLEVQREKRLYEEIEAILEDCEFQCEHGMKDRAFRTEKIASICRLAMDRNGMGGFCKKAEIEREKMLEELKSQKDQILEMTKARDALMASSEVEQLRTELARKQALLVRVADAIGEPSTDWWCPSCGVTECRHDGRCTQCGQPIEDRQPDRSLIEALQAETKEKVKEGAT